MAAKRRSYHIDPETAHHRSVIAARSRTGTDYHLRKLAEAAASLTGDQQQQLAELLGAAGSAENVGFDYYLGKLAAVKLTGAEKRRLAELLMPFIADGGTAGEPASGRGAA